MASPVSRRVALKVVGATLGTAAFAQALSPLKELKHSTSFAEFLQKHYRELSADELAQILARLEQETEKKYGKKVQIKDVRPAGFDSENIEDRLPRPVGCRTGHQTRQRVQFATFQFAADDS